MKKETYILRTSFIRILSLCFINIILSIFTFIVFGAMIYIVFTTDGPFWGRVIITCIALSFIIYLGLYPLIIYWNYYQHDKYTTLTIDKCYNEILYKNKDLVKKIRMEDIIRLEQYYSYAKMLKMQYYKIIIKDESPIIVTSLLDASLNKKIDNIPYKRINKDYLWLLKRKDIVGEKEA